jgi:hypothetical protein
MAHTPWGTDPKTWVADEFVDAAEMNSELRDKAKYLKDPRYCRLRNVSAQSIASGAWTALSFPNEEHDNATLHSDGTNPSRITIPSGATDYHGVWEFWAGVRFEDVGSGIAYARLRAQRTSSKVFAALGPLNNDPRFNLYGQISLEATDYVIIEVHQNSGVSKNILGDATDEPCIFGCRKILGTVTT